MTPSDMGDACSLLSFCRIANLHYGYVNDMTTW
jgi:hypothetical protein